jgi:hypothetical protein
MSVAFTIAAPLAAVASDPSALPSATSYELTSGRLLATVAGVVGLAGAVAGGLALAHATGRIGSGPGRRGAVASLVSGLVAMVVGAAIATTADGGLGTGNGFGGSVVAMLVGLVATVLGGVGLARFRRAGSPADRRERHGVLG